MDEPLLEQVGQLYATPADSFVAARNELVKTLKQAGDREAAAVIGRLRRPSWIDIALDRVSHDRPDLVTAFVDAAREAHRIQDDAAEGRRSGSLPEALRSVRAAQSDLASAADAELRDLGRPRDLAGATARLGEIAGDGTLLALLSVGVVGLEEDSLVAAFGAQSAEPTERSPTPQPEQADVGDPDAELRRDVETAARAVRSAERDAGVAATAAERARDRRDRAAATVEAAADAVRAAQEELTIAERALADHEQRLSDAERAAAETSTRAIDAAQHHDELSARLGE